MSTKLTPGKLAGLKSVSDANGVIAAAAMDQRGSLQKSLAKENGVAAAGKSALEEFKSLVTEVSDQTRLGDSARSRVRPAGGKDAMARACCSPMKRPAMTPRPQAACLTCSTYGRCAASRKRARIASRFFSTTPRLRSPAINDLKQAWVERIGDECLRPRYSFLPRICRL